MDRDAALPDLCVACNAPAQGFRVSRRLYYSPRLWRIGAFLTPFVVMLAGVWLDSNLLIASFWPLALMLVVANFFVRKSLKLELGLCARHRRLRYLLLGLSALAILGVVLGVFRYYSSPFDTVLLVSILALVVLGVVQSYLGATAVRLNALDEKHAWLTGTGAAFRNALPELN
jgi:nitrate reductase gamma subunit